MADQRPTNATSFRSVSPFSVQEWKRTHSHLPLPLTSFVGRAQETAAVVALLRRSGVRLVTLTGPGGVGKTRLSIRVAAEAAASFPDGLWFVALASVRDPSLVAAAVAQVLGVPETQTRTIDEGLCSFVGQRRTLIVLDNFEHVLDAGSLLTDMLSTCPNLTILVTSRTVLRVSGEHSVYVPPLALTPAGSASDTELPLLSEAVQLFIERAGAARSGFAATASDLPTIAAICAKLDGLPLALELAAAWSNVLTPRHLLAKLDHSLGLLTVGSRDMPTRHHSLRDAIEWSYDLLDGVEQRLFRRLAVFVGGFTESAAVALVGGAMATAPSLLQQLSTLVDKNLLVVRNAEDGDLRFNMLETIREYGLQRLETSDEYFETRTAHASWCLDLVQRASPFWFTSEQLRLSDMLETEHDNLRAALTWFSDSGNHAGVVRLTGLMWPFWFVHSHYSEGISWLRLALTLSSNDRTIERIRVLVGAGCLWWMQGDHQSAQAWNEEALMVAREVGDLSPNDTPYNGLAIGANSRGDYEEGERWNREALAAFRAVGDTVPNAEPLVSIILSNMAYVAFERGDVDRARTLAAEALEMQRMLNVSWAACNSLFLLARIAEKTGNGTHATACYWESFQYAADHRDLRQIVKHIDHYVSIDAAAGRFERVPIWLAVGQQLHDRLGGQLSADRQLSSGRATQDAKTVLGEQAFEKGWQFGLGLSLDELRAVAAQFEVPDRPSVIPAVAVEWGLTRRELDVLCLVAEGWTDREIANTLYISRRTVSTHVSRLLAKLGVSSRRQAATHARDCNLLASCIPNAP